VNDFAQFLRAKERVTKALGFEATNINPRLYPFQQDIVRWACRMGRAAIFADCGTGKTPMQLEFGVQVCRHVGPSAAVLILAPLSVAQQTVREGEKFGITARYLREDDGQPGIVVANYEMLEHFEVDRFSAVVLDESSILKAQNGKTRNALIQACANVPYRLACTATPAPNDFMELGNHCEFLGVMSRTEMLSMYFVHDGGSTQDWRIKGHAQRDFWRWVCGWAVMIRKPSDIGHEDGGFVLPPLNMRSTVIAADHAQARKAGLLFAAEARTLQERRAAKRGSIDERVAACAALVASESAEQWLVWCNLNDEGDALERAIPGAVQVAGSDSREHKEAAIAGFLDGSIRVLISKASVFGFGLNLQCCARMAFVGLSDSFEQFYQAVRRCWRFGQARPVDCHVITSELEGAIVANIQRKEADLQRMVAGMVEHMRSEMTANIKATRRQVVDYQPAVKMLVPQWVQSEVQP
jgi:superfamily II DNA or RNA helicase